MLPQRVESFQAVVLPHLRAAYNLARWLLRNDHDAEDVTQEAIVRAFRFFDGFSGDNPRAWLLSVVRNSAYTFLSQNRARELGTELDLRGAIDVEEHVARCPGCSAEERALRELQVSARAHLIRYAPSPEFEARLREAVRAEAKEPAPAVEAPPRVARPRRAWKWVALAPV